jgi:hypothetical protein
MMNHFNRFLMQHIYKKKTYSKSNSHPHTCKGMEYTNFFLMMNKPHALTTYMFLALASIIQL